jgi:hypothetical protein
MHGVVRMNVLRAAMVLLPRHQAMASQTASRARCGTALKVSPMRGACTSRAVAADEVEERGPGSTLGRELRWD